MTVAEARAFADLGIEIPSGRRGETKVRCPKCSATRKKPAEPCLAVNVETGVYHCHHCGWAGSLHLQGGFPAREPKVYAKPEPVASPEDGLSTSALNFLARRGISKATAVAAGVTGGKAHMPGAEEPVETIQFPYFRAGELVNVKYRGPQKSFRMVKDAERILYGLDWCQGAEQVYLTEGELDALAIREVSPQAAALSVPNGAPALNTRDYSGSLGYLASGESIFAAAKVVVLATDADEPGIKLREELAKRIGRDKCWLVSWPEGCKDANDVLMQHGADALKQALNDARPYPVEGLLDPRDLAEQVLLLRSQEGPQGVDPGWPSVADLYRPKGGQLCIVTGAPGSGKSSWLDALMVNLAERHDWRFGVCSPENFPPERHLQNLIELHAGAPLRPGAHLNLSERQTLAALEWVADHFTLVLPEPLTLGAILERAAILKLRYGIQGLVIDPWNELEHERPEGRSETEHIGASLSTIRRFARDKDIHVWVVAHPAKMPPVLNDEGRRVAPVVTPYDISGSANFFNKADVCVSVWRDKEDESLPVQIHLQKMRFRDCGRLGMAELRYDTITGRYDDAS